MFFSLDRVMRYIPEEYVLHSPCCILHGKSAKMFRDIGFVYNETRYNDLGHTKMMFGMTNEDIVNFIVARPSYFELLVSAITASYIYDDPSTLENGHILWPVMLDAHEKLANNSGPGFPSVADHFSRHQLMLRFILRLSFDTREQHESITKCISWLNSNYTLSENEINVIYSIKVTKNNIIGCGYYLIGDSLPWMIVMYGYYGLCEFGDLVKDIEQNWTVDNKEHVMGLFAIHSIREDITDDVIQCLHPLLESAMDRNMIDLVAIILETIHVNNTEISNVEESEQEEEEEGEEGEEEEEEEEEEDNTMYIDGG